MCFISEPPVVHKLFDMNSLQLPSNVLSKIKFVNPELDYKCICCQDYFVQPYQLQCGHRICEVCHSNISNKDQSLYECESGDNDCIESQISEIRPDYSVIKELGRKEVYCINENVGCKERPLLKNLKKHCLEDCQYVIIECPYDCGLAVIKKNELEQHKEVCPKRPQLCKLSSLGCQFKGSADDLDSHMSEDQTPHLEKIALKLSEIEVSNLNMKRKCEDLSHRCSNIEHLNKRLEEEWNKKLAEAESLISEIKMKHNQSQDDFESLESSLHAGDSLKYDVMKEVEKQVEILDLHKKEIKNLELRLQCIDTTNYEGMLVWKINNFRRRLNDAVEGRTLSLYSQPFYTDRYGYKMCARVYLNGDGIGKGQYVSLFFVIMRGDYDEILPWPFKHKVTLMLLDQKSRTNDVVESFLPDPGSSSFMKPTSIMNIASGSPRFISHSNLLKNDVYLKNDIIFFRIVVSET